MISRHPQSITYACREHRKANRSLQQQSFSVVNRLVQLQECVRVL